MRTVRPIKNLMTNLSVPSQANPSTIRLSNLLALAWARHCRAARKWERRHNDIFEQRRVNESSEQFARRWEHELDQFERRRERRVAALSRLVKRKSAMRGNSLLLPDVWEYCASEVAGRTGIPVERVTEFAQMFSLGAVEGVEDVAAAIVVLDDTGWTAELLAGISADFPLDYRAMTKTAAADRPHRPHRPLIVLQGSDKVPLLWSVAQGKYVKKRVLTGQQYRVLQALLKAPDTRLSLPQLVKESGLTDARGIFMRLRESDPDYKAVMQPAERGRAAGYRIALAAPDFE